MAPISWHELLDQKLLIHKDIDPGTYTMVHSKMHGFAHGNTPPMEAIRNWCDELYDQERKTIPELTNYLRVARAHEILDELYADQSNRDQGMEDLTDSAYMSYSHSRNPHYNPK